MIFHVFFIIIIFFADQHLHLFKVHVNILPVSGVVTEKSQNRIYALRATFQTSTALYSCFFLGASQFNTSCRP